VSPEEFMGLLEEIYQEGWDAMHHGEYNDDPPEPLEKGPAVERALSKLRDELRSNISLGDERQIEDSRSHYVDVQVEKDFYAWLWGDQ
jgi:hypothetical protein